MARITDFGKSVKIKLLEDGHNQNWLIAQVREKTGLYFDSSYLWKIMHGESATPGIVRAIREILDLPADDPIIPQNLSQ
jgi:hypothetical protein